MRRRFGREFKVEAVRLIGERGVSVSQAARDLDVHEHVLRKWMKELAADRGKDGRSGGIRTHDP
jgi:transposase